MAKLTPEQSRILAHLLVRPGGAWVTSRTGTNAALLREWQIRNWVEEVDLPQFARETDAGRTLVAFALTDLGRAALSRPAPSQAEEV